MSHFFVWKRTIFCGSYAPLFFAVLLLCASSALGQTSPSTRSAIQTGSEQGAPSPANPKVAVPLLPPAFAGLPREGNIVTAPTPATFDAAHAGLLKEDGLTEASTAQYAGDGPARWTVQVLRFGDATGAYSAFTFYRDPGMQPQAVGDDAAANGTMFLVRSNAALVMVRATGSEPNRPGASLDAERLLPAVQALVLALPRVRGPEAVPPTLPGLLPGAGLQKQTMHYAIGPAGYNGPIPVSAIPFDRDAEAVTAAYRLRTGQQATLTLVMLPTPQIAGALLRGIQAMPDATLHVATRRSGALVAVVSGAGVPQAEAQRLLNQISYIASVTMDQPQGYTSEVAKAAKLLLGIAYLTLLLAVASVTIAVFLGGGRLLVRRLQGKPDSSLNDDDFISLKL